jgi:hypothetical protein
MKILSNINNINSASAAAKQSDIPYCIVFSCWQRRVSTTLQKLNARVLYLAQCKIAGNHSNLGPVSPTSFVLLMRSKISIEIKLLSYISYILYPFIIYLHIYVFISSKIN